MYTYYVYHIPGIKIGCTTDLNKRMKDQGFTNWEILWQEDGDYEFGWIAGNKEIELQKEYALPIDDVNYQISRNNRREGGKIGGLKAKESGQLLAAAKNSGKIRGPIQGRKNVESGHLSSITPKSGSIEAKNRNIHRQRVMKENGTHNSQKQWTCTYCNKSGKGTVNYSRWHGENCKLKNETLS